jgi:hypothetical protein
LPGPFFCKPAADSLQLADYFPLQYLYNSLLFAACCPLITAC